MTNVIVNATALRTSGALSILKQFLMTCSLSKRKYIIFVAPNLNLYVPENCRLIELNKTSWLKRIYWDFRGLFFYLKKNKIKYDLFVSLQNTSVYIDVPQVIYMHQSLPFISRSWSLIKKSEYKLYLYKNLYPFFIFFFVNDQTTFIVQTKWVKEAINRNFGVSNIEVIPPSIDDEYQGLLNNKPIIEKSMLYPAAPLFYKNHLVLLEAMGILQGNEALGEFILKVTFDKGVYIEFDEFVRANALGENVKYLGYLSPSTLSIEYENSHTVVFPSYVETYGLPLAESASIGKKILCSDLPFSREVLENYDGAVFLKYNSPDDWATAINRVLNADVEKYVGKEFSISGWQSFFELLDNYNV